MSDDLFANIEISPLEVRQRLERGEKLLFVDVREPWEYAISHIDDAKLIPMGEIPKNLPILEEGGEVILICHHGMRSLDAAAWLRSQGVDGARSMAGGIERWAVEIDPKVPRY